MKKRLVFIMKNYRGCEIIKGIGTALLISTLILIQSCSKDEDPVTSQTIGPFVGSIQVADDPQTQLGYVHNASASVIINGSNATIKITGDLGFDREYVGKVTTALNGYYDISLSRQSKPSDKVVGERLVIANNQLTINILIASDKVIVTKYNSTETIEISGKLGLIGSNMVRQ